jgi:hypothetical protein
MIGLRVEVRPPTLAGRLYPRVSNDIGWLAFTSDSEHNDFPFGANIDALIILDADEDRLICYIELMYHRSRWKRVPHIDFPQVHAGDLHLLPTPEAQVNLELPVRVDATAGEDVRVTIGEARDSDRAVALSDNCVALIAGDVLTGFVIRGPLERVP